MNKAIRAADLFAGAGGASLGLARACESRGARLDLVAVNHWPRAVETHKLNHPRARHFCEPVDAVNPRAAVPGGHLDLLLAGPECTHHSTARGGKPVNDQSRASAWCILRWATALTIDTLLIENVPEFASWAPLGSNGKPLRSRKGETFRAFIDAIRALGYRVDWRVLNAADYGDPTTRQRLFIQARRGRRPITWAEPTHAPGQGETDLFGTRKPWKAAREVIDWTHKGKSIFNRKRPLSDNTVKRIEAGLRKFGGKAAEPFLVLLRGTQTSQVQASARSVDEPLPTVTAQGQHIGLAEPFVMHATHHGSDRVGSLDSPLPTITAAHRGELALVEPFLIPTNYGERPGLPTVTTADDLAVCEPFLVNYHGNGQAHATGEPLRTVDCRDRYGLVEPVIRDILFRMLSPRELARGNSFPDWYEFAGTREEIVRQVGNAWPGELSAALCGALLDAA